MVEEEVRQMVHPWAAGIVDGLHPGLGPQVLPDRMHTVEAMVATGGMEAMLVVLVTSREGQGRALHHK